ncbi:ATP-dependent helicase [Bacillus alkalisoli]|uniref:ATP-dependent helicase n=1 Tax=Bacillus alkalisoli TaxID=2011008 RepID=UPI000C24D5C7|nr:ATP-dependent helicase [Bacillus alkalisoli]
MKNAIWNGKLVSLENSARDRYQHLYDAGVRNELACGKCSKQVKLYLGIQKAPYFYHANKIDDECNELAITTGETRENIESTTYTARDGFKIPKSRAIHDNNDHDSNDWKLSKPVSSLPIFLKEYSNNKDKMEGYFEKLSKQNIHLDISQQEAVRTVDGPLLVLAGAGSGKTRVLTSRVAYMIEEKNIDPRSIMLVTFTAKAAQEMKERLKKIFKYRSSLLNSFVTGTFHSIFYRILSHQDPARWNSNNLLKWDWQKEQFLKQAGRKYDLDEKDFPFDQAIQFIGLWKNSMKQPEAITPTSKLEEQILTLYKEYEQWKANSHHFDFDDMLIGCYELLKNNEALLKKYQNRFRYFLIDEFQDINKVQYETMKLLAVEKNICVVGDDDQSIYAFRGSDPSFILNFHHDFKNTNVVTLSENYRSTHTIVAFANKIIEQNKQRKAKRMGAQFDNTTSPHYFFPFNEEEEATMIVHDLKEKIEQGASPNDFSILYRTHSMARAVFERLSQSGLPFSIDQDYESFYNRRIVKSMIAFLKLSTDPNDVKAFANIFPALFLKQSALQDAKATSILEDCSLVETLSKLPNLQPFQVKKIKKIVPLFLSLSNCSPTVALEIIEKDMGFSDYVKKRGSEGNMMEKGSDDISDLKVVAKKFSTVNAFLEHVDDMLAKTDEMKRLSKHYETSIQLSTIHRTKGLEYNYVYLLGVVDGGLPHDYALESFRNGELSPLEEERRLLYVAVTRAKVGLYLSILDTRRGKQVYVSRFLKDSKMFV